MKLIAYVRRVLDIPRKENKIIKKDGYYELIIVSTKYGHLKVLIDDEDIDLVKDYYWTVVNSNKTGIRLYAFSSKLKKVMHRVIMSPPDNMQVDHINGDSLDNRKYNLRICTVSDNNKNRPISKLNKSGATGVGWHKKGNSGNYGWKAYIKVNKKLINLGFYDTFEEALEVRLKAEEKYFGEFNRDLDKRELPKLNIQYYTLNENNLMGMVLSNE